MTAANKNATDFVAKYFSPGWSSPFQEVAALPAWSRKMKTPKVKMTPDELAVVELCLRRLTEEQIEDCRARIKAIVVNELEDENYEALLEQTMVSLLKRNVREARLDQILQRDRSKQGKRSRPRRATAPRATAGQ